MPQGHAVLHGVSRTQAMRCSMAYGRGHMLLQDNNLGSCTRLAALNRQGFYCVYLAHHELESIYYYYYYYYYYYCYHYYC